MWINKIFKLCKITKCIERVFLIQGWAKLIKNQKIYKMIHDLKTCKKENIFKLEKCECAGYHCESVQLVLASTGKSKTNSIKGQSESSVLILTTKWRWCICEKFSSIARWELTPLTISHIGGTRQLPRYRQLEKFASLLPPTPLSDGPYQAMRKATSSALVSIALLFHLVILPAFTSTGH